LRIKKNILFEEQGDDAVPSFELGGSGPRAVEEQGDEFIFFPKREAEQK